MTTCTTAESIIPSFPQPAKSFVEPTVVQNRKEKEHIVHQCQLGDERAFRELYNLHVAKVFKHVGYMLGPDCSEAEIEDIVQVVFLNVFRSIKRFRGDSSFSTWLFRIAVNTTRQEIRRKTRWRKLRTRIEQMTPASKGLETTAEQKVSHRQQLHRVLSSITPKKRETLVLHLLEGYTLQEIAQICDSKTSTIASRLTAAKVELVKMLSEERPVAHAG